MKKMNIERPQDGEIDQFDLKIMEVLAEDGRITITDLAKKVGLSSTPC